MYQHITGDVTNPFRFSLDSEECRHVCKINEQGHSQDFLLLLIMAE